MTLLRNGQAIPTIFDLLGANENDMTGGLAYVMSQSKIFLNNIAAAVTDKSSFPLSEATVKIQTNRRGEGITDIEVDGGSDFFAILEAKRDAVLPTLKQMEQYAPIVQRHKADQRYLVTISNASAELFKIHFPSKKVKRLPLKHLTWRDIRKVTIDSLPGESNSNKQLLNQFVEYLSGLLGMETKYSNMVYVVSLAKGNPEGWGISWIDIVEKRHRYFYPIGSGGWPDPPPNYIGIRYDGKLQAIHRVTSYDTMITPRDVFPEAAKVQWEPHYVLKLGPAIVPQHEVRNGPSIHRAMRCWCMIDTLLTCNTISEALAETKKREKDLA